MLALPTVMGQALGVFNALKCLKEGGGCCYFTEE